MAGLGEPARVGLALAAAGRGLWWYLKQATGEAKWDEYVERCRVDGRQPVTRRDFERHRAEHRERSTSGRCC